ncbi:A disintegrin and metallopeptidase domain 3-like isoform X2 [Eptesicus fuscus]|uniref:A disintegrin and metallopeptidase domain 3-like isoform X2 n=1 Tax=Eptesicus fuscus TaxID=29078 RepID=UPI002403F8FE|nr:A disintegrin and metallopeptidase domain 3-like isoform X2 [Eptesicus fuscus]
MPPTACTVARVTWLAMLFLLLILSGLGRLTFADHYSETSHLQITVPWKLGATTNDADVSETQVIYAIQINRKTYTLHLKKQSFLHPHFLVYSYNKSGKLYPDSSFEKGHCLYQGYAAEIPLSVVTLSTCSGLRGLLLLENVSYGIEPLESSAKYEHMLYQIKNKADFLPLQDNYPMIHLGDEAYRILVKSEKKSDVALLEKTLKIQIIMDKALYGYMGSEAAVATEKIVHIFGLVNTMFSQLKLTVMLTSLEIWSDKNKILCTGEANELLQRFVSWRENNLFQRSHDMAFLLIYRDYPNYMGATYHGRTCDRKLAVAIAQYPKRMSLEAFSVVIAQLLGVNLGLRYDDIYNCYCPGTTCIMNPQAIRSRGVKSFSSCSVDEFKHVVSQPEFECLQNQTISKVVVQGRQSRCGDKHLDVGEECDCGSPEIRERGHLCRKTVDPCDFPEFCDGIYENCPTDVKSADLEPCNNQTAFCYKGICRDPTKQCAELFGKFAKGAAYVCAEEVNFLGDPFGVCLPNNRCDFRNTLCAKLVCQWTHSRVLSWSPFDVQYTYLRGYICMSARRRSRLLEGEVDITRVYDGTVCGEDKVCLNGTCVRAQQHKDVKQCNAAIMCRGNGVCNTEYTCQCRPGYAPPQCTVNPSSPGGNIYDGFWIFDNSKKVAYMPTKYHQAGLRRDGLLISFCLFLSFFILIAIIALKWKKMKFWKREGTLSEGTTSMSEDSSTDSNRTYTELKQ